jgi:hypothetical protein
MKKMDVRNDPIPRFISRMFETPALRTLPALQKEEQALQFLRQNGPQLQPLLASMGIAASAGWQGTFERLAREIRSLSDAMLETEIFRAVEERLHFEFYPALEANRQPPSTSREEIVALCRRSANHPVSRRALSGSLSAVLADVTDKYISQIWERRKYSYVEITKVQRLSLKMQECADLLRFVLLVRPAAYLHVMPDVQTGPEAGFAPVQEQALQRAFHGLTAQLAATPPTLVRMAIRSALPYPSTKGLEAIPRLAAIFALRGRALIPTLVVDRGADSPDKSWFNIARRNASWRCLDPRMLDELYSIASENGW